MLSFFLGEEPDATRARSITEDYVELAGSLVGGLTLTYAATGQPLSLSDHEQLEVGQAYRTSRSNSIERLPDGALLLAGSVRVPIPKECSIGPPTARATPAKLPSAPPEGAPSCAATPTLPRGDPEVSGGKDAVVDRCTSTGSRSMSSSDSLDRPRQMNHFLVNGIRFDVDSRYSLIAPLGKGAYGAVCKAMDNFEREKVAIKKLTDVFENPQLAKRVLREIKILRHFDHDNIMRIKDILRPASLDQFDEVYIVSELVDTDLHQIIATPQPLTDFHCQYILHQILLAVEHIHGAGVVHRDLKPSNVLLSAQCDVKLCDFGMARSSSDGNEMFMTEYVATRWYRAPEMMLSSSQYSKPVDVWSVGCIFAELLGRRPLFPGKDHIEQLNLIIDVVGTPADDVIERIEARDTQRYVKSRPKRQPVSFSDKYPDASLAAVELLARLLSFDELKRMRATEALAHKYFSELCDDDDKEAAPVEPKPFDFDFEKVLDSQHLKDLVVREMLAFHSPQSGASPAAVAQTEPAQSAVPDA
uniref:Mitogen-activated protein kinase n=1 Tax=Coccolithus braarudii TaxID=221442 RepID=A0A7S0Q040_9EUKA|mmetsp:Transcript_27748/g.59737  ORF Transcript_27748/g.59737 Transcript_27748/m.59737 type:complete len:530 (+) Transcript_27748:51-1640(+)